MATTKPGSYRVYVNDDDTKRMHALCSMNELEPKELLDRLVSAGLRAVESDGGRITLPLRFAVVLPGATSARYLNDPKPGSKR